jgi:hypothetical protein
VTATNESGSAAATSGETAVVTDTGPSPPPPPPPGANRAPIVTILGGRRVGARTYIRFRVCDDSRDTVTLVARDVRPGRVSATHRYTLIAPRPCRVYTRSWIRAARFRGPGVYRVTLIARDVDGRASVAVTRRV